MFPSGLQQKSFLDDCIVFNYLNTGIGLHLEMGQTRAKKETRTKITIDVSFMCTTMIHKQHKADVTLLKM